MLGISQKAEQQKPVIPTEVCHKHCNQPKSFYCNTCRTAICRDCTVFDHKTTDGHLITSIGEAVVNALHTLQNQASLNHVTMIQIQGALQQIEYELQTLDADKASALKGLHSFINLAQQQLDHCEHEATDSILKNYKTAKNKLLDNKRQLQEARTLLGNGISQAMEIKKVDDISQQISYEEKLKKDNNMAKSDFSPFCHIQNCFASDVITGLNGIMGNLFDIGKTCLQSNLPHSFEFSCNETTAGLRSILTLELLNDAGNKVPFAATFLTIKMTDPWHEELPITLSSTHPDCTVAFTPQRSGKHKISILYLGQKLKSDHTHIMVNSNNPVLKFGKQGNGNGTFQFPGGIAIGRSNCLYVADTGNRLIQKFTAGGKFMSQFRIDVNGDNYSTLDLIVDEDSGLITCTEVSVDECAFATEGNKVLVFNLEGEIQKEYINNEMRLPVYIAVDSHGNLIIVDRTTKSVFVHDKQGNLINEIGQSEGMMGPSYMCVQEDDSIIVSDTGNHCIKIFNSEGVLMHQIGSYGNKNSQLSYPFGVACDGENILVVDSGNERIQVFKNDGTFVSMIESHSDPLDFPRGLAVTRDGYLYVTDRVHHCVKKYKYKDMP